MRLLTQIFHQTGLPLSGRVTTLEAVRAIVLKGKQVLLVYSIINRDYKFPGGGMEEGEDHATTLQRELLEECGAQLKTILGEFGRVEEFDLTTEDEFDLFQMNSYYYLCEVEDVFGHQTLEDYEFAYGFTQKWVSIEQAIVVNRSLLENPPDNLQRWVRRELFVLELLSE